MSKSCHRSKLINEQYVRQSLNVADLSCFGRCIPGPNSSSCLYGLVLFSHYFVCLAFTGTGPTPTTSINRWSPTCSSHPLILGQSATLISCSRPPLLPPCELCCSSNMLRAANTPATMRECVCAANMPATTSLYSRSKCCERIRKM